MSGEGGEQETTLEFTPTWIVAAVCTVIVAVSYAIQQFLRYGGRFLKKKHQKPLNRALKNMKEELMMLGISSLLLVAAQNGIAKICIPRSLTRHLLPCSLEEREHQESKTPTSHFQTFFSFSAISGTARRLLTEEVPATEAKPEYCSGKDMVPLLSIKALNHLDNFIFILAVAHMTYCLLTITFGKAKIRQWKQWEDWIHKEIYETETVPRPRITYVSEHAFVKEHLLGAGTRLGWLLSFFKQFYGSLTKSDYVTLRRGFIMTHCRANPKFNFHKYMVKAFECDFEKVVGISWYFWIFVVIFLLLNINGWNTYFWIAFVPFFLLLAVGTKLEHVITELAHEVAEKFVAIEGELVVRPSDDHFWFHRPRIVLFLIHFILFQNSFEIAFFFWIWVTYGFDSCIMGKVHYVVPRLIIGAFIQVICSYSTLPLYAIVTQMGNHFNKAIFDDHVKMGLVGWAEKAKKRRRLERVKAYSQPDQGSSNDNADVAIQLVPISHSASLPDDIVPVPSADGSS